MRIVVETPESRKRNKRGNGRNIVYRIFYGERCVYVGRTSRPLSRMLEVHFLSQKKGRAVRLDVTKVTRIEYFLCKTKADMWLYQMYWIHLLHPAFNKSCADDEPTIALPNRVWMEYRPYLMDKWRMEKNGDGTGAGDNAGTGRRNETGNPPENDADG